MYSVYHLIQHCGSLKENENILILYDTSTEDIINLFVMTAKNITRYVTTVRLDASSIHGVEPSDDIARIMMRSDLIICLTQGSLAHTNARMNATKNGSRFLSMPLYSRDILKNEAILFDYKSAYTQVKKYSEALTMGKRIIIKSKAGTYIEMDIANRAGNCCPGFVTDELKLGSPPDVEANIAPVEEKSHGVIIIDGSITHPILVC